MDRARSSSSPLRCAHGVIIFQDLNFPWFHSTNQLEFNLIRRAILATECQFYLDTRPTILGGFGETSWGGKTKQRKHNRNTDTIAFCLGKAGDGKHRALPAWRPGRRGSSRRRRSLSDARRVSRLSAGLAKYSIGNFSTDIVIFIF